MDKRLLEEVLRSNQKLDALGTAVARIEVRIEELPELESRVRKLEDGESKRRGVVAAIAALAGVGGAGLATLVKLLFI